jgi:hypothetical protein
LPSTATLGAIVNQAEKAILEWIEGPIQDDLGVLLLKPR